MRTRILFTGGGGCAAEALWRYLSGRYDLFFCDAEADAINDVIPVDRRISIPLASSEDFIPRLKSVTATAAIDVVVPGVDEELEPLCKHRDDGLPKVLLPSLEFVQLMLNKFRCANAIREAGLAVPVTLPLQQSTEIGFPLIVKPRFGRGSRGVCVLYSQAEILAYQTLYRVHEESLLAQELVRGCEYTIQVAGDVNGNLSAVIPVRVIKKKGITIRAETDMNDSVIEYVSRFQEVFRPHGVYNIQCMVSDAGRVLPFEINPRVSTTFCMAIAAGFDPFGERDLHAESSVFFPEKKLGLKRHWFNNIFEVQS